MALSQLQEKYEESLAGNKWVIIDLERVFVVYDLTGNTVNCIQKTLCKAFSCLL
jgi:hypothetical protein